MSTARPTDRLDHLVINVLFEMDAAQALFGSLGFQVTPRGHHTLGSINHLMMVTGCYLELVGLPRGVDRLRQEVLDSPLGASGFVCASDNIQATRQRLSQAGFEVAAIKDFSRPVMLDGATRPARFRTVAVERAAFGAGRVYWCQHLTPELVWREEWLRHDNGLRDIDHLVVQSPDASATACRYAEATGSRAERDDGRWLIVLDDGFRLIIEPGPRDRFGAIGLVFDDLNVLARRAAEQPQVSWMAHGSRRAALSVPSMDLVLDCRQTT